MPAGKSSQGECRDGKAGRDHQPGLRIDDAGKSVVTPSDLAPERTLIIGRADADAILLARFGWLMRHSSPFGGVDLSEDDPTEAKRSDE